MFILIGIGVKLFSIYRRYNTRDVLLIISISNCLVDIIILYQLTSLVLIY